MNFVDACQYGYLKKAKEIFEAGTIDIHANNEKAFRSACEYGHLEIAKWLIEISKKKKLICFTDSDPRRRTRIIDIHAENEEAFRLACHNDLEEISNWLIKINETTLSASSANDPLRLIREAKERSSSVEKKVDSVFGDINIYVNNDHLHVAKWLLTFYTRKELINLNHSLAKEELENRRKTNIELILYLFKNKFKLLDIHAIALIWKEFL